MRIVIIYATVKDKEFLTTNKKYFEEIVDNGTEVEVVGLKKGPATVENFHDVVYAGPEVLRIVREKSNEADAFVINCCSDPALYAAREITDRLVLGPTETSMSLALHLGFGFAYISPFTKSEGRVRLQAIRLGVNSRLVSVVHVKMGVADLSRNTSETIEEIVKAAQTAVDRDGAEVIMLGCTGMAVLAKEIRKRLDVPVIEPAETTVKVAELFVKLGLHHHRRQGALYSPASFQKIIGYE